MNPFFLPSSFYPTPPALIKKMLGCIDFEQVDDILEPSAGDGAIAWAIAEKFCNRYNRYEKPVDCIELDDNLRALLQSRFGHERLREFQRKYDALDEMYYSDRPPAEVRQMREYERMIDICKYPVRVVHDDFLTYSSAKQYDAIIMNPPFETGDAHLHKALNMMRHGGQIVCLLNAETIRNPYTSSRKILLQRLSDLEASIQFLTGEFESKEAQRTTSVEVALISATIPAAKQESVLFDRLQKAKEEAEDIPPPESLMRIGDKVVQMVEQFSFETQCGLSLIREYEALRPHMLRSIDPEERSNSCILTLSVGAERNVLQHCDVNEYLRQTRLKYWRGMLDVPEFVGMLTSNLQEEFQKAVEKMADYDFTEFNIRQVLEDLQSRLSEGVDDTILQIFDKLTFTHSNYPECKGNIHYYNGWRTNKAHKIGKKSIIPTHGVFSDFSWDKNAFNTTAAYRYLADIEKVLNYLDDGTTGEVDLGAVLRAAKDGGQSRGIVCKFFTVDLYKKGTTHIRFHTQDVVDRLNIYGSRRRGWLPPDYGRKKYEDLNQEERAVVDDFQGQKAYERVTANPDLWLMEPQKALMLEAPKEQAL